MWFHVNSEKSVQSSTADCGLSDQNIVQLEDGVCMLKEAKGVCVHILPSANFCSKQEKNKLSHYKIHALMTKRKKKNSKRTFMNLYSHLTLLR